jgi:hypothetical protein
MGSMISFVYRGEYSLKQGGGGLSWKRDHFHPRSDCSSFLWGGGGYKLRLQGRLFSYKCSGVTWKDVVRAGARIPVNERIQ